MTAASSITLVTTDPAIRDAITSLPRPKRVDIALYDDMLTAEASHGFWAGLVLADTDALERFNRISRPVNGPMGKTGAVLVTATSPTGHTWEVAAASCAKYAVFLPQATEWLTAQIAKLARVAATKVEAGRHA